VDGTVPRRVYLSSWRDMAYCGRRYLEVYTDHELPLYMKSVRLAILNLDLFDVLIGCSGSTPCIA
jgi:hypothetical protein